MNGHELNYFRLLDRTEQEKTVQRLAASGMQESVIASLTGLGLEIVSVPA